MIARHAIENSASMTGDPFWGLSNAPYGVILADPPWSFRTYSSKGWRKTPHHHYDCMPLHEIVALPVGDIALRDSVCVMWTTAPFLPAALDVLAAWGFAYKTAGAWAKRSSTGRRWAFGTGYIYRGATEFWILGTRGSPKQLSRSVRNLIVAPTREHSRKPDEMRETLVAQFPGPHVELFARETTVPGWDLWGSEVGKFSDQPEAQAA